MRRFRKIIKANPVWIALTSVDFFHRIGYLRRVFRKVFKAIPLWAWLLSMAFFSGLIIHEIPQWHSSSVADAHKSTQNIDMLPKEQAEIENQLRGVLVQALGGFFFIATTLVTWRNLQSSEDKQVTERFSKAVEMLSAKQIDVRLGGIYLLERIARDSPEDHPTVMEFLTNFIRKASLQYKFVPADIQAALTVIGRRKKTHDLLRLNLTGSDLKGADLSDLIFGGTILRRANLCGAHLYQTYFCDARLEFANLSGAFLGRAELRGTKLKSANLSDTDLRFADLRSADLSGANLSRANLRDIKWDSKTNWKKAYGLDTAKKVPEKLRKQLGLLPLVAPSEALVEFDK